MVKKKNLVNISKENPFSSLDPEVNTREIQELSQKTFASGHEAEAVVMLHGWIENFLNFIWEAWCSVDSVSDEKHKIEPKSYLKVLEILYEIGLIDDGKRQEFIDFNSLRNNLAHNMFGVKRKKLPRHQILTDFDKGLSCSGLMIPLFNKLVHVLGKRHKKWKSMVFKRIRKATGKI